MNTPTRFFRTDKPIVYIRPVAFNDLPADIRAQIPPVAQLYAIHDESGDRVGLVSDRATAFIMARQNDMEPVSVH
jgi:hypothetical protein